LEFKRIEKAHKWLSEVVVHNVDELFVEGSLESLDFLFAYREYINIDKPHTANSSGVVTFYEVFDQFQLLQPERSLVHVQEK
jgi:hypothetical protein